MNMQELLELALRENEKDKDIAFVRSEEKANGRPISQASPRQLIEEMDLDPHHREKIDVGVVVVRKEDKVIYFVGSSIAADPGMDRMIELRMETIRMAEEASLRANLGYEIIGNIPQYRKLEGLTLRTPGH